MAQTTQSLRLKWGEDDSVADSKNEKISHLGFLMNNIISSQHISWKDIFFPSPSMYRSVCSVNSPWERVTLSSHCTSTF